MFIKSIKAFTDTLFYQDFLKYFQLLCPCKRQCLYFEVDFFAGNWRIFFQWEKKKWFLQPLEITWKGLHESKAISLVYKMNQSKEKPSVATGMKSLIQCANILNHDSLFLHNLALPGLLLWSCWFGGSEAMGSSWELPGARAELRTLRFYFTLSHMLFFLGPKLGLKMVFKSRSWELHMKCWLCCNWCIKEIKANYSQFCGICFSTHWSPLASVGLY